MIVNSKRWFVIINPTSGSGQGRREWPIIKAQLELESFDFDFKFTKYQKDSIKITHDAINQGFNRIISVGGDGTLHNIINGIQTHNSVNRDEIKLGIIPLGTGNDWVKTYKIPKNINHAIAVIKKGQVLQQDLGKIEFYNPQKQIVYFNNLAGVGFDGFVVSKIGLYKRLGPVSYILAAIVSLFSFSKFNASISVGKKPFETRAFMILIGLCQYSGGGMQLTNYNGPNNGYFNVSIVKNLTLFEVIKNLKNLYNGNIVKHQKVETHRLKKIAINLISKDLPFIEADGELLGKGHMTVSIIPKALTFFC